jgi:hypothetical protein
VCGTSTITKSHLASGGVAPVDKTVTYGTVTNIPGETTKCWITKNLGASQQATIVSDASEASAGWYWQFNRKQGYQYTTSRTPGIAWDLTNDNLSATWEAAKDPCTLELGTGWRIPTKTEWPFWFGVKTPCCRLPLHQRWFAEHSRLLRQLLEQFAAQRYPWREPVLLQWQQHRGQQRQGHRVLPPLSQRLI